MSYGMMIAVELDKKAEFDALWNWSRTYMCHESPAHPAYGLFSWYLMGLLHCSGQYRIWTPTERG